MIVVPPLRRRMGDGPREKIPLTYPSKSYLFFWGAFLGFGFFRRSEERERDVKGDGVADLENQYVYSTVRTEEKVEWV